MENKNHPDLKIVVTGTRGIPHILGGIETHCEELYPRIVSSRFDITIVRRKKYVRDQLTSYKGVKLYDAPNFNKKSLEAIVHTLRAIHAAKWKIRANVVHIHAVGPAILTPYARLLGLRVVFTHHGPDYDRDKWGKFAKWALRFGERMGCWFADEVIVISSVINDLIRKKHKRNNAHLIHNGVAPPVIVEQTDYLTELGIEPHKYVFAMGRFVPEKNFQALIEAFSTLNPTGYRLVLAGDADIEDAYSRRLKETADANRVVRTGFIKGEKLQTLLSYAALFVLPSSHEGLPISLLEAMSYNLPVLASDIPANKEVGLPPSSYFHYDENKISNLTEALKNSLAENKASKTMHNRYDLSPYDWDRIAEQTANVYLKIQKRRLQ